MKRIVVVGPPCSGKTTTARAIAQRLDIPHVVIHPRADTIVWLDACRWTTVPRGIRRTITRSVLRRELLSGNREPLTSLIRPGWIVNAIRRHPAYNREAERLLGNPTTGRSRGSACVAELRSHTGWSYSKFPQPKAETSWTR